MANKTPQELADGTVADGKDALAGLSTQELNELRSLEEEGQNRSTFLSAIDEELEGRDDNVVWTSEPFGEDEKPEASKTDDKQPYDYGRAARMATMETDTGSDAVGQVGTTSGD